MIAAIELYAIQDTATSNSDFLLPCPADPTAGTGTARSHNGNGCNSSSGDNRGAVPWSTLGLAEADVIDSNGNYLTYIVNSTQTRACDGDRAETDALSDANGGSAGFVLVSHGSNGFGSFNYRSNAQVNPGQASTNESANCATVSGSCTASSVDGFRSGPISDTSGSTFFDDIVREISLADTFGTECESINAKSDTRTFITDDFSSAAGNGSNSDITISVGSGSSSSTESGGSLAVVEEVEIETVNSSFTPSVTPIYVAIEWTPTAATTTTGFSIITRADSGTRSSGTSNYTDGLTIDFFSDGDPANNQNIAIQANGSNLATSSGTYDLNLSTTYLIEVFDNGSAIWGRITQSNDTTNRATVFTTNTSDLATPNQVIFLHDDTTGAQSTLDNLLVALGSVVAENRNPTSDSITVRPGGVIVINDWTFEYWMRPTASVSSAIAGQVQGTATPAISPVLNITTGPDQATLTSTGSVTVGYSNLSLSQNGWTHIAYDCDAGTTTLELFINGSSVGSNSSTTCSFEETSPSPEELYGITGVQTQFSEARLWSPAINSSGISNRYQYRQDSVTGTPRYVYDMVGGFGTTTDACSGSACTGASATVAEFVGAPSPFNTQANVACPGNEHTSNSYACVFTSDDTLNLPLDIPQVRVKAWGGSGGGGTSVGGGASGTATAAAAGAGGGTSGGAGLGACGGGGDGYAGGGGGGHDSGTNVGGGGGGSGYLRTIDLTNSVLPAGSGTSAGNGSDTDLTGQCGANNAVGGSASSAGNAGCVVVCWSSSCLSGL